MVEIFCPKCENVLVMHYRKSEFNGIYGLIRCACSEHPIIADIPIIFWHTSNEFENLLNEIKHLIRKGKNKQAFLELCRKQMHTQPSFRNKWFTGPASKVAAKLFGHKSNNISPYISKSAIDFLLKDPSKHTAEELIDFYFEHFGFNNKNARDFFFYRFAQPRHLVPLSLASALFSDKDVIVDLGCGMGHVTRGIKHAHDNNEVVGIDNNFFLLYIARHCIARHIQFICADADGELPFKTNSIDGITCANSFHFFSNKQKCAHELNRTVSENGVIFLSALRHSDYPAPTSSHAIGVQDYIDLFGYARVGLYSDNEILHRYLRKEGPDLNRKLNLSEARRQPFVTLVAARNEGLLRAYQQFDEFPHARSDLHINPLYREKDADINAEIVHFELAYPSQSYKEEQPEMLEYLPQEVIIPTNALLEHNKNAELIADLISKNVLIDMPVNYVRRVEYK